MKAKEWRRTILVCRNCDEPEDACACAEPELVAVEVTRAQGPIDSEVCDECGKTIDRGLPVWWEVWGWEQERVGGGTNHVALRRRSGRVMCEGCMHVKRGQGPLKGQTKLAV